MNKGKVFLACIIIALCFVPLQAQNNDFAWFGGSQGSRSVLADVEGVILVPGFITRGEAAFGATLVTMDADGELAGGVFESPRTGNISKIGFRTGSVNVSDALKISIQTVDAATGRPTGTLIHSDAFGVQASVASFNTYWVSLQNPVAVARGDIVAVVVEFNSFVAGNLIVVAGITKFSQVDFPYVFHFVGGGWTLVVSTPDYGFVYDDGVIEPINNVLPAVGTSSTPWDTNDATDRYGLMFSMTYNCQLSGVFALIDLDGDAEIEIYGSDGAIIPDGTISLDANIRAGSVGRMIFRNLVTPYELNKDTFYRIAIHPTTSTDITIYTLDVTDDGANEAMNAIDGGVNFFLTTKNGSDPFVDVETKRPIIGLIIDQIEVTQ